MKKAFTMLELVIVIVVIGILAAMVIPRLERDNLAEAVDQIASHIRYTQHLAMQDNKFSIDLANPANDTQWYRQRWTLSFNTGGFCGSKNTDWTYSVYFDGVGGFTGNLNSSNEAARDPQNPSKIMSAGWSSGASGGGCNNADSKYNITKKFGITRIDLSNGCGAANTTSISFDEFGRPMKKASTTGGGGATRGYDRILIASDNCFISIGTADKNATIYITPETGFTRVSY
ncbi:prepilin-type N-terminal cleavage/methylation domain-containing protein [Campylobacter showae]|uniref:prepilin-type N-terminal cleavage/methylation domain-containing protein n=1 Tax=Campylobacter showae TaxID=204 RepID=UPI000F083290|nr:prepilin-type N-terminal cleavage/methylation domain-containing protein [Campylobacter showae]